MQRSVVHSEIISTLSNPVAAVKSGGISEVYQNLYF